MTKPMTIKWRLAAQMAQAEIDYKALAEKVGLHPVYVNRIKNTYVLNFNLTPETLEKLCNALDCQPGDLLAYQPAEVAA